MIELYKMNFTRAVTPIRPAAAYIGGKRRLAEMISRRIEAMPHDLYAEPFIGMGGVFFRRRSAAKVEVINDVSRDVVTLFRILQRHYPQFMETLKYQITSRAEFHRLETTDPSTLTDLERAARFLYVQRLAFGGKVSGRNYGVDLYTSAGFDVSKLGPLLADIHDRLCRVSIECLGWLDFVDRYDTAGTLFYLDPPYWGSEASYGEGVFSRADFAQLADRLATIEGRFILSINDVPGTRHVFERFVVEPVITRYTMAGGAGSEFGELLVMGPGNDAARFEMPRDLLSI
jgi:DNA adenine methylase